MREHKYRAFFDDRMWEVWKIEWHNGRIIAVSLKDSPSNQFWFESTDRPIHLMQFTGLKDKNGVEIYEGNIVRILYTDWPSQSPEQNGRYSMSLDEYKNSIAHTLQVIWSYNGFYLSQKSDGYAEDIDPGRHGFIEVIGNIYETPDLLPGE